MTQDEIILALSMHGYERAWLRGTNLGVPFVGQVRAALVEFVKRVGDGPDGAFHDVIHVHFPMEGEAYCTRSLKFLHRKALKDLERWNVLLPPEVLNVLRHCS